MAVTNPGLGVMQTAQNIRKIIASVHDTFIPLYSETLSVSVLPKAYV